MNENIKDKEDILHIINKNLEDMNIRLSNLENKIESIEKKIDCDIVNECKKMGNHINFIENVYDNVKHPLGYINNKLKYFIGKEKIYSLTNDNNDID